MLDKEEILRLAEKTFKRQLHETERSSLLNYIIQSNITTLPGAEPLLKEFKNIFDRLKPLNATVIDAIRIKNFAKKYNRSIGAVIKRIKDVHKATINLNPGLSLIILAIEERPHDRIVYQVGFIQSKMRRAPG